MKLKLMHMKRLSIYQILFIFEIILTVPLYGQTDEAVHVEYSIRTPVLRRYMKLEPTGTEYYVSVQGDDQNPGTKDEPFQHIQKFADIAQPGDICLVRKGIYRETVQPKSSGLRGDPILYVAYPGEKVTISGTEPVTGKWSKYKGSIYQIRLDVECQQLFMDGEMMIVARWPNMRFDQIWERSSWASSGIGSSYGKMVDPELAKTDVDWTGAIATLNIAHQFSTWTRRVTKHSKGSDTFEYPQDFGKLSGTIGHSSAFEDDFYYLSGKLGALDIPTEWYYDAETKMLYLWTPDGKSPEKHKVEVKVRDKGFEVNDLDEIHLIGFNFFACTFQFENTVHSLVDGCHLLYPTYARELGSQRGGRTPMSGMSGSHNTIRNSTLGFTPVSGLVMNGAYNTLDNNLVHDVCWNGSLSYTAISLHNGDNPGNELNPVIVKGNTTYNTGSAGISFRGQAYLLEYNYVHHAGLMSHDVAAIYTSGSSISGSIVRYNWIHNCHPEIEDGKHIGLGFRLDDQGKNISVNHNVVWDIGLDGIVVKGEYNKVYNNTVLHSKPEFRYANSIRMDTEPEPHKPWRMDAPLFGEQNAHSLVFNNVVGIIRAEYKKDTPLIHKSNCVHNELNYTPELCDPGNFDFRPSDGSSLIDTGISMPGLTDSFNGEAPDIGAYEHGGINWIPGYVTKKALFYQTEAFEEQTVQ
jgi:hypothetical protein